MGRAAVVTAVVVAAPLALVIQWQRQELARVHAALDEAAARRLEEKQGHACAPFEPAPAVLPLLKHLLYPRFPGDEYGDGIEEGLVRGNPEGRIIIDVGLHTCEFVALAVARGYVVHGFDPRHTVMRACMSRLPAGSFAYVPVRLGSDERPVLAERPPPNTTASGRGFAYIYQVALGAAAGAMVLGVHGPFSSLVDRSYALANGTKRVRVPVLPLDAVGLDADVWLLKLDVQVPWLELMWLSWDAMSCVALAWHDWALTCVTALARWWPRGRLRCRLRPSAPYTDA
jgi:hypothetical protein